MLKKSQNGKVCEIRKGSRGFSARPGSRSATTYGLRFWPACSDALLSLALRAFTLCGLDCLVHATMLRQIFASCDGLFQCANRPRQCPRRLHATRGEFAADQAAHPATCECVVERPSRPRRLCGACGQCSHAQATQHDASKLGGGRAYVGPSATRGPTPLRGRRECEARRRASILDGSSHVAHLERRDPPRRRHRPGPCDCAPIVLRLCSDCPPIALRLRSDVL